MFMSQAARHWHLGTEWLAVPNDALAHPPLLLISRVCLKRSSGVSNPRLHVFWLEFGWWSLQLRPLVGFLHVKPPDGKQFCVRVRDRA